METRRSLLLGLVALAAVVALPSSSAEAGNTICVVARKGSALAKLTEADVKKLYTGGSTSAGAKARLHDYGVDLPIRDGFYKTLTGRDGNQMHSFWVQFVFAGNGRGPVWVRDGRDMVSALTGDEWALGYLYEAELTGDLEVVWRLPPK